MTCETARSPKVCSGKFFTRTEYCEFTISDEKAKDDAYTVKDAQMAVRRFDRARAGDRWHRHRHALLTHRPWPPVAHSITLVALFSST